MNSARACAAALALVVGAPGCTDSRSPAASDREAVTAPSPVSTTPTTPLPFAADEGPSRFVSVRNQVGQGGSQAVAVSDADTGRVERVVLPDPWEGMAVNSTAVDATGHVWVTLAAGPRCSSNVAGCGPVPDSCSGEVMKIAPATGRRTPVLTAAAHELIGDAQPSPDGRLLAYLDGACDRSYFNQHIEIRDLSTSRSWSIGGSLEACHSLGSISWTRDSTALVVFYGPSALEPGGNDSWGYGTCVQNDPNEVAVVPALAAAGDLSGTTTAVDPGCQAEAVTATAGGYAAIEACGTPNFLTGPAYLLTLSGAAHISSRMLIGACVNGAELRTDASGTDLIGTSYQFCNPPGTSPPRTVAFTYRLGRVRDIIDAPNGGSNSVTAVSW